MSLVIIVILIVGTTNNTKCTNSDVIVSHLFFKKQFLIKNIIHCFGTNHGKCMSIVLCKQFVSIKIVHYNSIL